MPLSMRFHRRLAALSLSKGAHGKHSDSNRPNPQRPVCGRPAKVRRRMFTTLDELNEQFDDTELTSGAAMLADELSQLGT